MAVRSRKYVWYTYAYITTTIKSQTLVILKNYLVFTSYYVTLHITRYYHFVAVFLNAINTL